MNMSFVVQLDRIMEKTRITLNISDPRVVLSTTWVFVLLNMVYADILGMLKPGYLQDLERLSQDLSAEMVLGFAFFMEVPIIMVLLSRLLPRQSNRIANFIGSIFSMLWVVVPALISSLGSTPLSYLFFSTVEVAALIYVFQYALRWPKSAVAS